MAKSICQSTYIAKFDHTLIQGKTISMMILKNDVRNITRFDLIHYVSSREKLADYLSNLCYSFENF